MSGLSRTHSLRTSATFSLVRYWLRSRMRSGEPGIIRNSRKLSTTIARIVKTAWTTFRPRYRPLTRRTCYAVVVGRSPLLVVVIVRLGTGRLPAARQGHARDDRDDRHDDPDEDRRGRPGRVAAPGAAGRRGGRRRRC